MVEDVTWSPADFVVYEYEGPGCGRTTTSTSIPIMSTPAAGNGRCVEVLIARIGGRQQPPHPQHLGFRVKLDSVWQPPIG